MADAKCEHHWQVAHAGTGRITRGNVYSTGDRIVLFCTKCAEITVKLP
jgi:hypothetical protein